MINKSEEVELFPGGSDDIVGDHFKCVEPDGFAQGSALSRDQNIAFFHTETGGQVYRDVFVSLFESFIFLDVVQVVSSDNHCAVHFRGNYHSSTGLLILKKFGSGKKGELGGNYTSRFGL